MATTDTINGAGAQAMSLRDWNLLLLLGLLWGGSFFFARVALFEMPPLTLVFFRVAIAALALHAWLALRGPSFRAVLPLAGSFVLLAIFNNLIPFSLVFLGQTEIGAGLASVVNATTPFWTILVANAFTADERLTRNKVLGVALGVAGTAIMIGPGLVAGIGGPVWAKLSVLGAALSYAAAVIYAKRFRAVPPVLVAAGQLSVSAVLALPPALAVHGAGAFGPYGWEVWSAVTMLALPSTALGYIIYFSLIRSAGATNASLVTLIVPASAILLGAAVLGERLELFELAGMATIAAGLIVIDGRLLQRR